MWSIQTSCNKHYLQITEDFATTFFAPTVDAHIQHWNHCRKTAEITWRMIMGDNKRFEKNFLEKVIHLPPVFNRSWIVGMLKSSFAAHKHHWIAWVRVSSSISLDFMAGIIIIIIIYHFYESNWFFKVSLWSAISVSALPSYDTPCCKQGDSQNRRTLDQPT